MSTANSLRNQKIDDRKWEASKKLVAAYNDWQKAKDKYGMFSEEANLALKHVEYCDREYERVRRL